MKLFFCDCETTGTNPDKHGLIQFSGMIVSGDKQEEFDFKIQPFSTDIVEDSALAVNHLNREMLDGFDSAQKVYREIQNLLSRYVDKYNRQDKFTWIGYNARFDVDFVRRFFEKNGDSYFGSWFYFPPIDVMNLAAFHLREERQTLLNMKLSSVAYKLKLTVDGELHDALTDIRLTKKLYEFFEKPI